MNLQNDYSVQIVIASLTGNPGLFALVWIAGQAGNDVEGRENSYFIFPRLGCLNLQQHGTDFRSQVLGFIKKLPNNIR